MKTEDKFIRFSEPTHCHLWQRKDLTAKDLAYEKFEKIEKIAESNHFNRKIIKCGTCGQLYFFEFLKIQDWISDEDDIYRTFIPVEKINIPILKVKDSFELLAVQPRLHWVNDRIFWVR